MVTTLQARRCLASTLAVVMVAISASTAIAAEVQIGPSAAATQPASSGQGKSAGQDGDPAFDRATQSVLPLSPAQIKQFENMLRSSQAAEGTPQGPINPVSRSIDLTLKPGEKPPLVHMALGNASTLTISDSTGQPWPILSVTTGNPAAFSAQMAGKAGESNIIVVAPKSNVAQSNLVVTLVGYPVPLLLMLKSGYHDVDFRLDMRVAARGPNALYDVSNLNMLPPTADAKMQAFLDGTPPDGAKKLQTSAGGVDAWSFGEQIYVRTNYAVLSPAYTAKSSNVSGVSVYVMQDAPVLIVSDNGQMRSVSILNDAPQMASEAK